MGSGLGVMAVEECVTTSAPRTLLHIFDHHVAMYTLALFCADPSHDAFSAGELVAVARRWIPAGPQDQGAAPTPNPNPNRWTTSSLSSMLILPVAVPL